MRRRNRRRAAAREWRAAAIERVEERCLLAGVVGMSLANNGNLTLTGDAEGNHIEITVHNDNWGRVTGIDGTLIEGINGGVGPFANFPLGHLSTEFGDFSALLGNLTINMGDGDDNVDIVGTSTPLEPVAIEGHLDVDLGAGDDEFSQFVSFVGDDAEVRGGAGASPDYIAFREVVIPGELFVHSGATSGGTPDQILVDQSIFFEAELRGAAGRTEVEIDSEASLGALGVFTGSGDDSVILSNSLVFENTRIDTGPASNSSPGDYVALGSGVIGGNLRIDGRQGQQTIDFIATQLDDDFAVGGRTLINTRGGSDRVRIDNSEPQLFGGDVDIRTGGGGDVVEVEADTGFQSDFEVRLGGGADTLEFDSGVQVNGNGLLNGGGGFDTITNSFGLATWVSGIPTPNAFEDFI